ncbi:hypothetical protein ACGFYU_10230 [Streptomyces sp. NPDC048337]|uniref:hypothetical protein n=1 Tax=Streptomyces sp. NPDC048337 TaxID=3365535 RepID=UPI0037116F8A
MPEGFGEGGTDVEGEPAGTEAPARLGLPLGIGVARPLALALGDRSGPGLGVKRDDDGDGRLVGGWGDSGDGPGAVILGGVAGGTGAGA